MKLNVKLYGTLSRSFDDYDLKGGLEINGFQGTSIHDLLVHLNLESRGIGMIFMDGRPAQKDSHLKEGGQIKIFQPIFGG